MPPSPPGSPPPIYSDAGGPELWEILQQSKQGVCKQDSGDNELG